MTRAGSELRFDPMAKDKAAPTQHAIVSSLRSLISRSGY